MSGMYNMDSDDAVVHSHQLRSAIGDGFCLFLGSVKPTGVDKQGEGGEKECSG